MLLLGRSWLVVLTAALAVGCAGCQKKPEEKQLDRKSISSSVKHEGVPPSAESSTSERTSERSPDSRTATVRHKKPETPPEPPTIPKVMLSDELRKTCLLNVGDTMPKVELADLDGKPRSLESLYGEKLTVVCFWKVGTTRRAQRVAAAALQDLTKHVADPFSGKGVQVVGVDVQDTTESVRQEVEQVGVRFPVLVDARGETFARVAKDERMPRVFLLDGAGRVLWFDVEYSQASRRELLTGIRVGLGEL